MYEGGIFNVSLPGGRAGASIQILSEGIVAQTPSGERFVVPYSGCTLEQGGASGRMLFCRTPDRALTIFCEDKAFAQDLRHGGSGLLVPALEALQVTTRGERSKYQRYVALGLLAFALLCVGAFYGVRAGAKHAVMALPVAIDKKLGDIASVGMGSEGGRVDDPVVVKAIEAMVQRLKPHASLEGLDFRVSVVDSTQVNAYCLPGGRIVVYTGLIKKAASPDEVAGVLGHEMAHATLRHSLERLAQSAGVVVGVQLLLGDVGGLVAFAADLAQHGLLTSYGRDQERAADNEGLRMMHAAHADGTALARFFATLAAEEGGLPDELSWLSSHPQLDERRAAIAAKWEELGAPELKPWDIDWNDVLTRLGKTIEAKAN